MDCVYIFLRGRRDLNPAESKTSRHLHPVEEVYCRKVALGEAASAVCIHSVIEKIVGVCDVKNDIKRFCLRWYGELIQLLPYSLLYQFYEMVRISHEGELVINNYTSLAIQGAVEIYERKTGVGIQKAVNSSRGTQEEQDAEDIEILITDEEMRAYIQGVIDTTKLSTSHGCFREMYDFYMSIVWQIKKTRDGLRHLLPVQPNECLRVRIGPNTEAGHAFYAPHSANRGRKYFLKLSEIHYHASLNFPPTRYSN